jgi:hypothetical protein
LRASAFANMTNLAKLVLRNASSLLSTIQNALPTTLSQGTELNIYVPSSSLDDYTALYGSVYTVNDISAYGRYWFTPTTSETTLTSDMYVSGITAYLTSSDPYDGLSILSTITALGSGSLTPITSPTSTLGIYDLRFEGDITAFGTSKLTDIDSNFANASCPITKFRYGGSSLKSDFLDNAVSLKEYYLYGNPTNIGFYNIAGNLKIEYISASNFTGTITGIGDFVAYNDYLEKVSFPKAKVLGYRAFCHCRKLKKISLPEVTKMTGSDQFRECSNLTEASIQNVTNIDNMCFNGCSALTSVDTPLVTSIGDGAFNGCSALSDISSFAQNLTSIGNLAFFSCISLPTTLSFGSAETIGDQALDSTKCEVVNLPIAKSIGQWLFGYNYADCPMRQLWVLSDNVPTLGGMFDGLTASYPTNMKIYFKYANIATAWVATNWSLYTSKMVGVLTTTATQTLDSTLDISGTSHNVTWYSDENLTTAVSGEQPAGTYYAKVA